MTLADVSDAQRRLRAGGSLLFRKDSPALAVLSDELDRSDRRTVTVWALSLADEVARVLSTVHPEDPRPSVAVDMCDRWSRGLVLMPEARRAILDVHAMARGLPPVDAALCHAVGQGCSVVHTTGHALGLPMYELSAIVRSVAPTDAPEAVASRVSEYRSELVAAEREAGIRTEWAGFLRRCTPMGINASHYPDWERQS